MPITDHGAVDELSIFPEHDEPTWHPRQDAPENGALFSKGIPVRAEGQDLSGGHQGVHFTLLTDTATGGAPAVQQVLPRDYDRLEAKILAVDYPIVIAQSKEMAEAAANGVQTAGTGQQTTQQTPPGAGSNFTYTNTTGAPQSLLAASAQLVTDATVANRFLFLRIFDASGHLIAYDGDFTAIPASTTVTASAYQGATHQNGGSGNTILSLPMNLQVPAGGTVVWAVSSIDAGDQLSAITLTFASQVTADPQQPIGAYLPAGVERTLRNCDELWAAATSAVIGRISVSVSRRLGVESPDLTGA